MLKNSLFVDNYAQLLLQPGVEVPDLLQVRLIMDTFFTQSQIPGSRANRDFLS